MKRHYVVLLSDGYYKAKNKKDAMEVYIKSSNAHDVVYTRSQDGNYYHDRIKSILD